MGKWRYGVVLDAGSSGTRVHIYRWLKSDKALEKAKDKQLHSLPAIETDSDWTKKTHPGISTFGENPYDVGPEHLDKLISHALKKIPLDEVPNTPLFLLATAGMRILPPAQRKAVLSEVCDFVKKTTKFQLPDCDLHVQVIPGETEGLYGWIAANYLLGGFDQLHPHDHGKKHSTYGFLDMGGASAQIAFAPNSTEAEKHANDLTLLRLRTIDGTPLEYKVFVTTWLGFGVNRARQRYVQALVEASPKAKELPDPCMPSGLSVTVSKDGKVLDEDSEEGKGNEPQLVGTGDFAACLRQTYPLLEKDKKCLDEPCLLNGQHVPAIDFDVNHFVGVSEYWYTTHEMFGIGDKNKNKAYDLKTYQEGVEEFCTESWEDIEKGVKDHKWGKKFKESKAMEACFKASWLINMLHDGIGVPRVGLEELKGSTNTTDRLLDKAKEKGFLDPFQAVDAINGYEVSWTLGKMVLYASSEVQLPSENALPVGYGSNVVGATGIPKDFQYPGGSYKSYSSSKGDDDDDWREHLFDENPRRIPGFLLFLLIIFVIGFFSCGRERRKSVGQKVGRIFGRGSSFGGHRGGRRRGLAGKLFGMNSGPSYERVLEDGEAAEDFELGSFTDSDNEHSDSSDGSRLGRTSGWATPQNKVDQGPLPLLGAGEGGSGRDVMAQGSSLGLGPPAAYGNAIDRGGLMSRTDSRERLHNNGSRSGANSPKRIRSPMSRLTE